MLGFIVTLLIILGVLGAGIVGWLAPSPLPEPSPQWPLIVAYPVILLAILFLIAGLRLQHRLLAFERLVKIKDGDVIKGKDIDIPLLFQRKTKPILSNVTFDHCTLHGPCVMAVIGSFLLHGCDLGANQVDDIIIESNEDRTVFGVVGLVHCKFRYCKFENISWFVNNKVAEEMRKDTITV